MLKPLLFLSSLSVLTAILPLCGNAQTGETLLDTDTVQISPSIKPMIFKYFKNNDDGYLVNDPEAGKMYGRFEISFLGSTPAFQKDTIEDIDFVSYEDANFDGIRDIRIVKMLGASGGDFTEYWFYNPQTKMFENVLGELSEPHVNKTDSTIYSSTGCCEGRMSGSVSYKLINHVFRVVQESEGSTTESYQKQLIGDSLMITRRDIVTPVDDKVLADSSWRYLFGKLRLVQVQMKVPLDEPITPEQDKNAIADEDVTGRFLYISTELFRYSKAVGGGLRCSYMKEVVKNGHWVTETDTESSVQE